MSKFCANCGSALDDSAVVCGYCGTPCMDVPQPVNTAPQPFNAAAQPFNAVQPPVNTPSKKINFNELTQKATESIQKVNFKELLQNILKSKIFKIAAPCVAGLIVLLIVISIISEFTGYKGAIKDLVKAYEKQDAYALYEVSSEIYINKREQNDVVEEIQYVLEDKYENISDFVGNDVKIKHKVVKCKKLDDRELANYKDMFDDRELDYSNLKQGRRLLLKLNYKGDKRENDTTVSAVMLKEGKDWKFYYEGDYYYGNHNRYDGILDNVINEIDDLF